MLAFKKCNLVCGTSDSRIHTLARFNVSVQNPKSRKVKKKLKKFTFCLPFLHKCHDLSDHRRSNSDVRFCTACFDSTTTHPSILKMCLSMFIVFYLHVLTQQPPDMVASLQQNHDNHPITTVARSATPSFFDQNQLDLSLG